MALLFGSDDVIREEVEHSVFTGGLAGDLASFFCTRCTIINVFVTVYRSETGLLGEM